MPFVADPGILEVGNFASEVVHLLLRWKIKPQVVHTNAGVGSREVVAIFQVFCS